jgi:hypothetical protein
MHIIDFWANLLANLLTILASSIAILIYFNNRDKLASALKSIINYSNQITLAELKYKIERLNDYNSSIPEQNDEVVNIFHEIEGQILGNKYLKSQLVDQLAKLSVYTNKNKPISEPKKRSLVSELRESVRTLDASNFGNNNKD